MVALLLIGSSCGMGPPSLHAAVDFVRDVKPLLDARCVTCHGPLKQKGGLRLDAGALVLQGGKHGPIVQPKNPAGSKLIERVLSQDDDERMPSEGKPLSVAEVGALRDWIAAGATVPDREEIVSRPEDHWFFQPPERAPLPKVSGVRPAVPAIDHFIAAEWRARGLKPQQPADQATLLRRVYLDLIGLPPWPEEVAAFESDTAPDAYERVVDKLLADPRHGARWGRHFMDIWRYCDEMLFDGDSVGVPLVGDYHPWRWRDWIVDAINSNKPYDRMIQEMLAADELAPEDNDTLRATGYLVRSANELGERDVWLFDAVEHTAQAFLGVTMKCARCHDHKYDPIPQTDYYRLRAVFEPMQKRLDYLPGYANPRQSGLARIYDAELAVKTALYVNGNPQQKDTNNVVTPGAPALLKAGDLTPEELKLPANVAHPGRLAFVREARLVEVRSNLQKARAAFEKLAANGASTNIATPSGTNLSMIQLAIVERRVVEAKLAVAEIQSGTREGRDHHPFGFSVWLAGGGIKGGVAHGATDELGFHAVENRHYVTDIHATILHQLGLVPSRLDVPGRKRLEKDHGAPIHEILA